MQTVSKTQFKAQVLQYFQQVERTGQEVVITDRGRPVVRMVPFESPDPEAALKSLRGTVVRYDDPTEPVGVEDWNVLR
ncbi:MAG TPA: type II toxin-antitoxin system Phd/YefM family antitoxin [Thermoanaerobaculia bacterium]